ncbi:MAG TPA: phosphate ABC transporter ATP-binding protein PstB [Candidatus Dormibacteraeota bacterium]|nr:phosphate ABC transporter ATP-binding protein PstB [Candidatus Dormibacteraeota bacterium]
MADLRPYIEPPDEPARPELRAVPGGGVSKLQVKDLSFYYGKFKALNEVTFDIPDRRITAIIGPSGCGKSTLLRVFNRMYDLVPGSRATGEAILDEENIVTTRKLLELRQKVGMVFQRPSPFPMSIRDNISFAPRLLGWKPSRIRAAVEESLERAALLDEVKDRLDSPGTSLSGGQQQRLAIARCIAVQPQVILMDEPCSALDPVATLKIEDLMATLTRDFTIVIVTHNMQQAARVSDFTAFMLMNPDHRYGELIEFAPTAHLFNQPHDQRTEAYITGRFG